MQIIKILNNKSFLFFRIGIFLLVSIPSVSSIFFLVALVNSLNKNFKKITSNKWNYPILIAFITLIISPLFSRNNLEGWSSYLNWIGLGNWLPYFLCFFGFQYYTNTYSNRKKIITSFIAGSFPFIVSVFGQYFFNWYGPFNILNNLIVWYQRPLPDSHGVTGLFNNQNYAATWLLTLWPMCLASLKEKKINKIKKLINLAFIFSILICLILTRSRNGWFGTIISLPLIGGIYLKIFLIIVVLFLILLIGIYTNSFFNLGFNIKISSIIPDFIKNEFLVLGFENINNFERVKIWSQSINLILEKPLFGWGAGTFALLIDSKLGSWYGHPHNISLELAHSYGLPISFLLTCTIIFILYKSFKVIYLKSKSDKYNLFDKAWWTSSFTLSISQMVDIQYFDFRIGITYWILFAGLISIINSNKQDTTFDNNSYTN